MADATGQSAADSEAADRREAGLKAAADQLAAQRAAEDEALADKRTAEDRVLASSRARLGAAATAVQSATSAVSDDAVPDDPNTAYLRATVSELHSALAEHLSLAPDEGPVPA